MYKNKMQYTSEYLISSSLHTTVTDRNKKT